MISNRKLLVLAFTLAVPMAWIMRPSNSTAATSPEPSSETVTVDCSKGKSINAAIAASRARKIRIEASGTCAEAVVVERIGVTISGTAAGGATIDPPDVGDEPIGPAIRALGAHELTLEDLTLTGATTGLEASASRGVMLTRVHAVYNNQGEMGFVTGYGVLLKGSEARIIDSDISSNFSPLVANEGSDVRIFNSTITNNMEDGPFSASNSFLLIAHCNIAGNAFGPQAVNNSRTRVADESTVDSSGEDFAINNSLLEYSDSTITNMASSSAQGNSILRYVRSSVETQFLRASRSSRLELNGSTFEAWGDPVDGVGLYVDSDSYAQAERARVNPGESAPVFRESEITGNVVISRFSDASFNTGVVAIQGAVTCSERSRVTTNLTPTGRTRGCE